MMHKVRNNFIILSLFICSISYAASLEHYQSLMKKGSIIPIQEKYDALSDLVPGYAMLPINTTSVIPAYIAEEVQNEIYRAMINTKKLKPVSLEKWLIGKYGLKKAKNSQDFIYTLADEHYPCLMSGVCQPFIFESSSGYVLILSFYRFIDKGFPITVLRNISNLSLLTEALNAMLAEYNAIIENKIFENGKKYKIIVKPFNLECRTYIGQSTGEFDYISCNFIEQDGVTIRSQDDMFSRLFAYMLYTTEMVRSVATVDLNQYVNEKYDSYEYADYVIEGRVQLTDQINIFHVCLRDAKNNKVIKEVKFFNSDFTISGIWDSYHNIIYSLADSIFGKDCYGVVPDISIPGQGLFINNIFIGWDKLEKCVLPKGKHFIYTGDYFKPDSAISVKNKRKSVDINGNLYRSFFLFLDDRNWIFRGKDGERVWKLLEK
ncbi:MAG: hypothetical protein ACI4DS_07570 [Eubacterium sp.]